MCPVLSFTPQVEGALRWFDETHAVVEGQLRRVALPGGGALGDQDARLMEAMGVLRAVHEDLMRQQRRPRGGRS